MSSPDKVASAFEPESHAGIQALVSDVVHSSLDVYTDTYMYMHRPLYMYIYIYRDQTSKFGPGGRIRLPRSGASFDPNSAAGSVVVWRFRNRDVQSPLPLRGVRTEYEGRMLVTTSAPK